MNADLFYIQAERALELQDDGYSYDAAWHIAKEEITDYSP
jgi:hypothetical protein